MTTTETVEPWAQFYDQPTFLPPGALARWQREEAVARAEEQRAEQDRAERADNRSTLALWSARQHAAARGLRWDPAKPFEHMPDVYARADATFALQDAQQRDADRKALQEAGLDHLVAALPSPGPTSAGVPSPSPGNPSGPGPSPGTAARGRLSMDDPRADKSPAGKARRALRRWAAADRRRRFEVNP
jgi:hypothetical protein